MVDQYGQDLLRFITCGSVDDGKSTMIGRLLWETHQVFDDQLAALAVDSKRFGTQGDDLNYAPLVDGLSAEREQGITIDVAYRFFATAGRRFIVADTPGHEQYTRNMVTGASTAQAAVLLVDSRHGLQPQTRRHAYIISLLGVRHVVLAANKMDLVGHSQAVFEALQESFHEMVRPMGFASVRAIALSALRGDNLIKPSDHMPWYRGPTLLEWLEQVPAQPTSDKRLVFPVQWVNRPNPDFRGYCGSVAEGRVHIGDRLRVSTSGQEVTVAEIVTLDGPLKQAGSGEAITLRVHEAVDISRGDVLTHHNTPVEVSDQFEVQLVWLSQEAGMPGRSYRIQLATQATSASITALKHRINVTTQAQEACTRLALNDIAVCTLSVDRPLAWDAYERSKSLGAFILIDKFSNNTVAAGMVRHSLRRADNLHRQATTVTRAERERLKGQQGKVVWFTGLSGSGKSTLANALEVALHAQGRHTYLLDGDSVRLGLNRDLGFTVEDRVENIRRIAELAKLMVDAGLIVLTAFISPYRSERQMARELIGDDRFVEVYVSTPLCVCEERDPKGLYRKARQGLIPNMTGVSSPYEAPSAPDLTLDTSTAPLGQGVDSLVKLIQLIQP